MEKRRKGLVWLLMLIMLISMAGCKSTEKAAVSENAAAATEAAELAAEPTGKSRVTVYLCPPVEWDDVYIWAWQEGGEDATDVWLGMNYTIGDSYFSEVLPGWIDRVTIWNAGDNTKLKDLVLDPGKDVWIVTDGKETTIHYEDPQIVVDRTANKDPFELAAEKGDFETMKQLLPGLEDRSILTDWLYNDFNYEYAVDAIRSGDYDTAVEFFGYCAYEGNQAYSKFVEMLVAGDWKAALETIKSMDVAILDLDLDMSWAEIIGQISGIKETASELDWKLMEHYIDVSLRSYQPSFNVDDLTFGEHSSWMSVNYVGEIVDTDDYWPVANFNTLKSQCGSEANGKVLILRSQMAYPQGTTYYGIDEMNMDRLTADLYPASLSEVEYIILVNYGYTVAGQYRQTFTSDSNSFSEDFTFLRMKGQVQLLNVTNGQTVQSSQWVQGSGEAELNFSDENYQCSNMPEIGEYIISAVEKVQELTGAK